MAIAGKVGALYASTLDAPTAFTNEPTTNDVARKRYQITDITLRYWPPDEDIVVKRDGAVVTTGFHLERAGGVVVFNEAQDVDDTITVSGKAVVVEPCGGFFNWSIDMEAETVDITTFESEGWKEFAQTINNWSGSAEAFWGDDNFAAKVGSIMVVKLFVDSGASQRCFEGFAVITGDSVEVPHDDVVNESIDFQGTGPLYARL